jgi:HAD superfamily phosphoserine phosphatase-like hydrolase
MKKEKQSQQIIYRAPEIKVIRDLGNIKALGFDLDGTLIDVSLNVKDLDRPFSWAVIDKNTGLSKNKEWASLLKLYLDLEATNENQKLREETNKKLKAFDIQFYKGLKKENIIEGLYPIPYLPNVKYFFDQIHNAKNKFFLFMISSAPTFYVKEVANDLGFDYFEGCKLVVDDKGSFTGEKISNGLHGKGKSLEYLCEKYNLKKERTIFHGDQHYDSCVMNNVAMSCAIGMDEKLLKKSNPDFILPKGDYAFHPLLKILKYKS